MISELDCKKRVTDDNMLDSMLSLTGGKICNALIARSLMCAGFTEKQADMIQSCEKQNTINWVNEQKK
ncbi:MAG: hypothetical protein AABW82_05290 [Nanoarchaeota archaeon]